MKVPKEIANKVERYEAVQKEADSLYEEISHWFNENTCATDCYFGRPFIADKPTGDDKGDDEYCDQHMLGEDWYSGNYYHKIEDSDKWVGYSYEC